MAKRFDVPPLPQVALLEIVAPCAAAFCLVLCSTPKILISEARSKYNRMALECYKVIWCIICMSK